MFQASASHPASALPLAHADISDVSTGEADGTVRVLFEKTRGPTTVLKAHSGAVTSLVSLITSWQDSLFVSAGLDRIVRLWGPDGDRTGHFRVLQELRVAPGDEQQDPTAGPGQGLQLPAARRSALAPAAAKTGDALFVISGGRRVVVWGPAEEGDAEDRVAVLDVVARKQGPALIKLFDCRGHSGGVKSVTSGGEDEIVTLDVLDTVRVFSTRTRAKEASLRAGSPAAAVTSVLCVPAGGGRTGLGHSMRMATPVLLLGREDGSIDVHAWPTAGGARLHAVKRHSGRVTHLFAVGDSLLSAGLDHELPCGGRECVRFSNLASGHTKGSFTTAPVTCVCSRTQSSRRRGMHALAGSALALTGHVDGKAILWDVARQCSLHILDGHHKAVTAIFANALCAVSGGEDSTCRVWRFADSAVLQKEAEEVARGTRQAQAKAEDAKNKYRKRQWEAAAALYSEAIALDPNDLLHLTNRAAVHFEVLCLPARLALPLLLLLR